MNLFWKIVGLSIGTTIVVNGAVNLTSRIRRSRLEDENYQEDIKRKRDERLAKQEAKAAAKAAKAQKEV